MQKPAALVGGLTALGRSNRKIAANLVGVAGIKESDLKDRDFRQISIYNPKE